MPSSVPSLDNEIDLNEDNEIQDILGHPPSWILRWGIATLFFVVLIFITMSWFIKYPDIVNAPVYLVTGNPPVKVVAKTSGELDTLLVEQNESVKENDALAIINSTAKWKDIQGLKNFLNANKNPNWASIQIPKNLQIGNLQNAYSTFNQHLKDYQFYYHKNIDKNKAAALEKQIQQIESLNASIAKQIKTIEEEKNIALKNLKRQQNLFEDGGNVSQIEVERAETNYLQYKRQVESNKTNILNNEIRVEQLKMQILEIGQGGKERLYDKKKLLAEDIKRLETEINDWKLKHLILAPISGKIALGKYRISGEHIRSGDELLTIVPVSKDAGKIFARGVLPPEGAGKIQKGTVANIQLLDFPYQEFGVLESKVEHISLVPEQLEEGKAYQIDLSLDKDLVSTYGDTLTFRQEMPGTAQLITEDRSIADRIFDKLLSLSEQF